MSFLRTCWAWLRGHLKMLAWSGGLAVAVPILVYAVVYVVVETRSSPSDERLELADGTVVAYLEKEVGADGPPVILFHGSPGHAGDWKPFLERTRVDAVDSFVAVDRLNFGDSGTAEEGSLAAQAKVIGPAVPHNPILVGHHYGAAVALRAAIDEPNFVAGLVLVAGATNPHAEDHRDRRELVDSLAAVVPTPWERANREMLTLAEENGAMARLMPLVSCPVVIVHGTADSEFPHEDAIAYLVPLLKNAPSVEVIEVAGAGIDLIATHPEKVDEALRMILAKR